MLNPSLASTHEWYALFLAPLGRLDEAIREIRKAIELDPLSPFNHAGCGYVLLQARRYKEAVVETERALQIDPHFPPALATQATALALNGEFDQALATAEKMLSVHGRFARSLCIYGYVCAASGRREEALAVATEIDELAKSNYIVAGSWALLWCALGDLDRAFAALEKGAEAGDPTITYLNVHPVLDPMRSDRRYGPLLRRLNLG